MFAAVVVVVAVVVVGVVSSNLVEVSSSKDICDSIGVVDEARKEYYICQLKDQIRVV